MAHTSNYFLKFEQEQYYHVYNRTVGKDNLFMNEGNYAFFLRRYNKYLNPYVETIAYCLLPNHFHLLIHVRPIETDIDDFHLFLSRQFGKFFQSYVLAFNKQQKRRGTLLQTPFKRSLVSSQSELLRLVAYIHKNPQNHGLIADFKQWKWSSYWAVLSDEITNVRREKLLDWVGGKEFFKQIHND